MSFIGWIPMETIRRHQTDFTKKKFKMPMISDLKLSSTKSKLFLLQVCELNPSYIKHVHIFLLKDLFLII